jgi:hypothetical protein
MIINNLFTGILFYGSIGSILGLFVYGFYSIIEFYVSEHVQHFIKKTPLNSTINEWENSKEN